MCHSRMQNVESPGKVAGASKLWRWGRRARFLTQILLQLYIAFFGEMCMYVRTNKRTALMLSEMVTKDEPDAGIFACSTRCIIALDVRVALSFATMLCRSMCIPPDQHAHSARSSRSCYCCNLYTGQRTTQNIISSIPTLIKLSINRSFAAHQQSVMVGSEEVNPTMHPCRAGGSQPPPCRKTGLSRSRTLNGFVDARAPCARQEL